MSSLTDKLSAVNAPKQGAVHDWMRSLPEDERKAVWKALNDKDSYKNHTLLNIFREEGGRFGKESFIKFRQGVLDGSIKESDVS